MGFGLSRKQLLIKTGRIVKSLKLKTQFKKDVPGKEWFKGLKGRHPELTIKKPQKLSVTRAKALNREVVQQYFNHPKNIWNYDETNMQMEHNPRSVDGRKGAKIPGRVANSKESISVLGCGNAVGNIMSPMVIVKGKTKKIPHRLENWRCPPKYQVGFPGKILHGSMPGGWLVSNSFPQRVWTRETSTADSGLPLQPWATWTFGDGKERKHHPALFAKLLHPPLAAMG